MHILCLRNLLIPRIRTPLKLVQGNRRFSNRIPRSFTELKYRKTVGGHGDRPRQREEQTAASFQLSRATKSVLFPSLCLPLGFSSGVYSFKEQ